MPLDTQTFDIHETLDDLETEREELAEQVADADPESGAAQQLVERGQQMDRFISGLEWYRNHFGKDRITVGALTNGERHLVRNTADRIGGDYAGRQNAYVAMGTADAPYLEHDPEDLNEPDYEETIKQVAQLHPAFVDWMESKITDLGRLDGDTGKSFESLVLEKRLQQTSAETNG